MLFCAAGFGFCIWRGVSEANAQQSAEKLHRIVEVTTSVSVESVASDTNPPKTTAYQTAAQTAKQIKATDRATVKQTDPQTPAVVFPLNLNAADATELDELPGIGEILAARIVEYRTAIGGFQNREQLLEVDGIGEKCLERIYDLLYLEQEWYPEVTTEFSVTEEEIQIYEQNNAQDEPEKTAGAEPAPPKIVNINEADTELLMLLPDMTEDLAAEIVALREQLGGFSSPYELLYAEGMTASYFDKIREFVQIEE